MPIPLPGDPLPGVGEDPARRKVRRNYGEAAGLVEKMDAMPIPGKSGGKPMQAVQKTSGYRMGRSRMGVVKDYTVRQHMRGGVSNAVAASLAKLITNYSGLGVGGPVRGRRYMAGRQLRAAAMREHDKRNRVGYSGGKVRQLSEDEPPSTRAQSMRFRTDQARSSIAASKRFIGQTKSRMASRAARADMEPVALVRREKSQTYDRLHNPGIRRGVPKPKEEPVYQPNARQRALIAKMEERNAGIMASRQSAPGPSLGTPPPSPGIPGKGSLGGNTYDPPAADSSSKSTSLPRLPRGPHSRPSPSVQTHIDNAVSNAVVNSLLPFLEEV